MKKCLFCKNEVEENKTLCSHCGSIKFDKEGEISYHEFVDAHCPDILSAEGYTINKKKIILVIFGIIAAIIVCIVVSSILSAPCKHNYKEEIVSDATFSRDGQLKYVCEKCSDNYTEIIPMIKSVEVSVLDKYTYEEEPRPREDMVLPDGTKIPRTTPQPSRYVLFDLEIKNVTDKDIKSFSGTLHIKTSDVNLKLSCSFDQTVPANGTIVVERYGFDTKTVNILGSSALDALAIYVARPENIQYEFVVSDVIFAD